jgi:hypothetical protein
MKNLIFVLLTILSLAFRPLPAAAAQATIEITNDEADIDFPESIEFSLEAESAADIESVTLVYGTNARACQSGGARQSVDIDADTEIEASWEWEFRRSGPLPPGTQIWWQWEIEDADGNSLTTDRQEITLEDGRREWRNVSEAGVTVYWYQGSNAFGDSILEEAITSLERLSTNAGIPQPETIQLWVYPDGAEVQDAIVNVPEWTGGVAFPEYGITVIGVAPGQSDWAAEIIPHELTHLVIGIVTFNCRGIHLPTWLEEGLAVYAEGEASASTLATLQSALAGGRLPSLRSLASGFSAYSDGANLAYLQSGEVVRYLAESYGPEQLAALLAAMQGGLTIDPALEQVYGFDTNGLDAEWRTAQGYAPTPTSEADAAALQVTPTLVPTLALGGLPVAATATPVPATPEEATPVPTDTPEPATSVPTEVPTENAEPSPTRTAVPTPTPASGSVITDPPPSTNPLIYGLAGGAVLLALLLVVFVRLKGR